jgi:tRNA(His) guanylyltransferase
VPDSLGDRMKKYEKVTQLSVSPRSYTIIRLDGRAFHSYTKGLDRPYDVGLMYAMQQTAKALCEQISGTCLGYTQSDEITLILQDFGTYTTQAFFEGNVQKIVSIAAAIATAEFNVLRQRADAERGYHRAKPLFDARVFTVPNIIEAYNCLVWRQQDATRNAIQMAAQSLYSHRDLEGKGWSALNEMLFVKGVNFDEYPSHFKRGAFVVRETYEVEALSRPAQESVTAQRSRWIILPETPHLTREGGREFFLSHVPDRDNVLPDYGRQDSKEHSR